MVYCVTGARLTSRTAIPAPARSASPASRTRLPFPSSNASTHRLPGFGVGVWVAVGVLLGVGVIVGVWVLVGVGVIVGVLVRVGVRVTVAVLLGVAVGVLVGGRLIVTEPLINEPVTAPASPCTEVSAGLNCMTVVPVAFLARICSVTKVKDGVRVANVPPPNQISPAARLLWSTKYASKIPLWMTWRHSR